MSNTKFNNALSEDDLMTHAFSTFSGCRDVYYRVSADRFDGIWSRTHAPVDRTSASMPMMTITAGRHHVIITIDDTVASDEFVCDSQVVEQAWSRVKAASS